MSHVRQQIRIAIEARLTGLATTGARVHLSRIYTVADVPALLIYASDEESELDTSGRPAKLRRFLDIQIQGLAGTADSSLDDTLDEIAKEVEVAVNSDTTFGGQVQRARLTQTEFSLVGDGEKQFGSVRLNYRMQYRTAENDPETANH